MHEKVDFGVFKYLGFFFQFKTGFVTKVMCCFVTSETFGEMAYIFVSSTEASNCM